MPDAKEGSAGEAREGADGPGQVRKLGAMVEWFSGVHSRIHEQIEQEKANEHVELSKEEAEALELERFQIESGRKEIAVETRAA